MHVFATKVHWGCTRDAGAPNGTERAALLHEGVQEAEAVEQALEGLGLGAGLEEVGVVAKGRQRVAACEVCAQARRRLERHLQSEHTLHSHRHQLIRISI